MFDASDGVVFWWGRCRRLFRTNCILHPLEFQMLQKGGRPKNASVEGNLDKLIYIYMNERTLNSLGTSRKSYILQALSWRRRSCVVGMEDYVSVGMYCTRNTPRVRGPVKQFVR